MRNLLFVLAACAAFAQDSAPRLVTVNVAATDTQGKAVTDLTAAELQVTDQGKAAPIVAFRNDALRSAAVAGEFTNRPGPALSRVQVILFDELNLSIANRKPAMEQIIHSLEGMEGSDSVYLYLLNLSGELTPVRGLPETPPDARPAATPWTRGVRPLVEKAVGPLAAVEPALSRDVVRRVQSTYAALEMLAGRMAALPGHKNILWTTFGVPCNLPQSDGQIWDCRPTLGKVTTKLDQANVAVSPVEMQSASADVESNVTLQHFVELTGGKLYGGGDIERAVADAMETARSSYRVQYAPAGNNWDGKAHKIRVTSTRKGVTVQATQSYTAEKAAAPANEKAALQNPFDGSEIGLRVVVTPGAQARVAHLRIGIDAQDLVLTRGVQLTFYVVGYLPDGRLQEYAPLPVNVNLTPEQKEKIARDGLRLGHDVTIPEGVKKIRLAVVDRASGTSGTVTIAVGQ